MLAKRTVIILGAGASVPYGFYSGAELLNEARGHQVEQFANFIPPEFRGAAPALHAALHETLETSIDAALETRQASVIEAGKLYMARMLLQCERNLRAQRHAPDAAIRARRWHELLWGACDRSSLEAFRATPLTLVTYNYDRLIEYALARSLADRFGASPNDCAKALDCIGPIHLHGQLGSLPDFGGPPRLVIPFGAGVSNVTDGDCITAAQGIKIVHNAVPTEEPFVRTRDAISKADRVIFLGFGYGSANIDRLLLKDCLPKTADIYLCTTGFTPAEVATHIRPSFYPWMDHVRPGSEHQDIVQFLRQFPEALI